MATKAETQDGKWSVAATSGLMPHVEEAFEMPFSPDEIIAGKYEVIDLVGVGGVGFVVAANHVELGERIALKFLRPEMLVRPDVVARFAQEALASVRIKNEHVARVFDVGTLPNGCPFIVMEYLEGRDLYDVVVHDGPQGVRRAVDYVLQACEALADAHACGIVHRDIKPENLFLIQRSEGMELVKVLDFGISKVALTGSAFGSKVPLVRTMLPMGSPVYMSPEQIRASKDIDFRTDIWSMGCVLHELLTGRPAFDAPSLTQLSATILEEHPPKASQVCGTIPAELDAIIARCLQKSPDLRFQNMAELALALYPFGPRRARLHAERCCMLLKVAGSTNAEFELPSVRPPGWETLPSGAYPTIQGQPRSTPAASTFSGTNPVDLVSITKPRRRALRYAIIGGVVLLAGLVIGLVSPSQESKEAPASAKAAAQPQSEAAPNLEPKAPALATAEPASAANPPPTDAATKPAENADPSPTTDVVSATKASKSTVRMQRPKKKAPSVRGESSASADPDPGF